MKTLVIFLSLLLFSDFSYGMARKYTVDEQTRRVIHGSSDAISQGRIDTADLILIEGKRVIPAPKKPIQITPIKDKKGNIIVVLPAKLNNKLVVARDSEEFQTLLVDRKLLKQYEIGEKGWRKYSESVEQTIKQEKADKDKIARELEKEKNRNLSIMEMVRVAIGAVIGVFVLGVILIGAKIVSAIIGLFKKRS